MWLIVLKGNHDIDGGDDIVDGNNDIDGGDGGDDSNDDIDGGDGGNGGDDDMDDGNDIDDGNGNIDGNDGGNGGDDDVDGGEWNAGKVRGSRPIPREKVSMTPQTLWLHTRIHNQCKQTHKYTNAVQTHKYANTQILTIKKYRTPRTRRGFTSGFMNNQCKKMHEPS